MPRLNVRLFMAHVHKAETGCWMWMGDTNKGYPTYAGRSLAHRRGYEHFVGLIPVGLDLDHLCRTRHCARPDHLEPVTRRENLLRGKTIPATNVAKTHCPQGHPYSGANLGHWRTGRVCRACRAEQQRRIRAARKAAS